MRASSLAILALTATSVLAGCVVQTSVYGGPDGGPVADASDAGSAPAAHRVSSLALSAGTSGAVVSYQLDCQGCVAGPRTATTQVRGHVVIVEDTTKSSLWSAGDPAVPQDPTQPGGVLASSALGDDFDTLVEDPDGGLSLLGGALPGGAVISARISTNFTVGKQTQQASFGERVRAGSLVSAGPGEVWFSALDATSKDAAKLMVVHAKGGAVIEALPAPAQATSGVLFLSPAMKSPAFAFSTGLAGADGDVKVALGNGAQPVTAPIQGVAAGLWTDGVAFRAAISQANGLVFVWDGKNLVRGPRVDEAACSAVAFDAAGVAVVAHVGPRSAVLYVQKDQDLQTPALIERSDVTIDAARVTSEFAIKENGVKRCGVAVDATNVYVAWAEPAADGAGEAGDVGLPTIIQVLTFDRASGTVVLRTRHDTVKNSVGNIR